jgi:small redox-active disulfide protein 2
MKIEILGAGCMKCKELHQSVMNAVAELDIAAEVVKVEDINAIMSYGVMMTPALVIDGVVKLAGKVPGVADIKKLIAESS